ncbi:hypothetical protein Dda_7755 [Drechslerella dactyloides]|uniref:Uncharacterized protein n=1 Tax=Drechslerella dactyloides TaxID=74499 RepID=A0AAD6NGZ3_DREDA|nr:hypothetical protein Dda_7755 [Drechslerella dactyloides]
MQCSAGGPAGILACGRDVGLILAAADEKHTQDSRNDGIIVNFMRIQLEESVEKILNSGSCQGSGPCSRNVICEKGFFRPAWPTCKLVSIRWPCRVPKEADGEGGGCVMQLYLSIDIPKLQATSVRSGRKVGKKRGEGEKREISEGRGSREQPRLIAPNERRRRCQSCRRAMAPGGCTLARLDDAGCKYQYGAYADGLPQKIFRAEHTMHV